jgi:hypothetical protein
MYTAATSLSSITLRQSVVVAGACSAAAVAARSRRSGLLSHTITTLAFGCASTVRSRYDPRLPVPITAVGTVSAGDCANVAWAAAAEPSRK